jgi:hypothetical protein
MLTLPPAVRVFIATEPADMRRSFDTLTMLAEVEWAAKGKSPPERQALRKERARPIRDSLVASCKRHRIDPFVYLRDVIARIPTHPRNRIRELLPAYWKPATSV